MQNKNIFRIILGVAIIIAGLEHNESYPRNGQIHQPEIGTKYEGKLQKISSVQISDTCPLIAGYRDQSKCGRGIACNAGNSTRMRFWWRPKIIDPRSSVRVFLDFVLPISVKNITATVDIHIFGDKNPMCTIIQNATCEQMKEVLSLSKDPIFISCPLQKGMPLKFSTHITSLKKLPTGNFTIITNVTNESGLPVICLKTSFEIRRN